MSFPVGGAGSGRDWLSHLPLEIQQLIFSFLSPDDIAKDNIDLIKKVYKDVMSKPITWDILAKAWKIEVERPKLEKNVKPTKEAQDALFKLTKAAILAHVKQVTDLAIKCISDEEVRAKIEKLDPLARYALIEERLSNPTTFFQYVVFYEILTKSAKEQSIAASKLFAQLLFGNVPKPDTIGNPLWMDALRRDLSTAIQIGSLEAVKILLKAGYNLYEDALENALKSYMAAQTTGQKQDRFEIIQLVLGDFVKNIKQSESSLEKLFVLAFNTGDLMIIKMIQRHGLVPPEASKEYAREQVNKNHELQPLLDQLLKPRE